MGAEFTVRKIDELTKMDDEQKIVRFYRHQIMTKGGVVLTVDISEKDFNAEKAAPILLKKAQSADAVLAL